MICQRFNLLSDLKIIGKDIKMVLKGKKYREIAEKVDKSKRYSFLEAVQLAIDGAYVKFDETVDLAVNLGVDPRKSDQMVRGTVVLPHGMGKQVTVLVFAKGEKEKEASDAGADFVGLDDLVEKIIDSQLGEGQFNDAPVTFVDITRIKEMFKKRLANIYHIRIEYPKSNEEG